MSSPWVSIDRIIEQFHLEVSPKYSRNDRNIKVCCPFCDEPGKYHMCVDRTEDIYFCFRCMDTNSHSGALDLYCRLKNGHPLSNDDSKRVYIQYLKDYGEYSDDVQRKCISFEEIPCAGAELLNAAYEGLLNLPVMRLSEKHRRNLLERGLTQDEITWNGYASGENSSVVLRRKEIAPDVKQLSDEVKLSSDTKNRNDVLLGCLIAKQLTETGICLDGVPGFYDLTPNTKCFRYISGLYIPTRDMSGRIVGLQVRRDTVGKNGLRYLTVSSKGFPGGVTSEISKIHVAGIVNEERCVTVNTDTLCFLTEGPLKADVAVSCMKRMGLNNLVFVALPGVSNRKHLPALLENLYNLGVREIIEALDMDKLENISVAKAATTLELECYAAGIHVNHMFWGTDELTDLLREAAEMHESIEQTCYRRMSRTAILQRRGNRSEGKLRDSKIKGIDDYLKRQLN